MALIKCSECGKEISDKATVCPICGNPQLKDQETIKPVNEEQKIETEKKTKTETGTWPTAKLVIGIVSIFLFILISFQSCAAGISNTLAENSSVSGSSGLFLAICMVIAGIVGIVTRKSSKKGGAIATIILYWIGTLLTIGTGSTFGDLPMWGTLSFIFGFVFLGSILINLTIFSEKKKIFKIAFGVMIALIAIIGLLFSGSTKANDNTISNDLGTTTVNKNDKKELQEVQLINSGYSVVKSSMGIDILYAVEISNPNEDYAISYPKITITAKDAEGKILTTENMTLNGIAAGDKYTYGDIIYYEGTAPTTVEISVGNSDDDYQNQSSSSIIPASSFLVSNVSKKDGMFGTSFTGEVKNNSTEDFSLVMVLVTYKSGDKIVGGETTFVDDLKSGEMLPFELSTYSDFTDYDSYEMHAIQW